MALQNLSEWCKLNGMLLNTDKTKTMLITTSQKRPHLHNDILLLTYNNDALNSVENEKVLGVRIDNNVTWSIHINFIAKQTAIIKIEGLFTHQTQSTILQSIYSTPH